MSSVIQICTFLGMDPPSECHPSLPLPAESGIREAVGSGRDFMLVDEPSLESREFVGKGPSCTGLVSGDNINLTPSLASLPVVPAGHTRPREAVEGMGASGKFGQKRNITLSLT